MDDNTNNIAKAASPLSEGSVAGLCPRSVASNLHYEAAGLYANMQRSGMREGQSPIQIDEAEAALEHLINDLPQGIFKDLNCGVILNPGEMYDSNGLLVLGQYHVDGRGLGRYVTIYFGSMILIYGNLPAQDFIEKLRYVLHHELTHHLESLAGDRSLEIQDAKDVAKMLGRIRH